MLCFWSFPIRTQRIYFFLNLLAFVNSIQRRRYFACLEYYSFLCHKIDILVRRSCVLLSFSFIRLFFKTYSWATIEQEIAWMANQKQKEVNRTKIFFLISTFDLSFMKDRNWHKSKERVILLIYLCFMRFDSDFYFNAWLCPRINLISPSFDANFAFLLC